MKNINKWIVGCSALVGLTMLSSCAKKAVELPPTKDSFNNSSLVQLYVATINASRNYLYVDGKPLNGAALVTGSVWPPQGYFAEVGPGVRDFLVRDTSPTATQVPLSFAENLQFGRTYTIFTYDTTTAPKQKTVYTDIVIPTDTTARIRFANFVVSAVAVPNVDIFSKRRNVTLFTNVAPTEVTGFIPVPSAYVDTFIVRETGTTNALFQLNTQNPTQKRSYTLVFRGRYQSTSGVNARTLASFINY